MLPRFSVLSLAYFLTQLSSCFAANRTIDDTKGDPITGFIPIYTPATSWNVGQNCSGCFVQPDPDLAFDSTWHDATQHDGDTPISVTLESTGTAVYLFSIVPNTVPSATTFVNLQFTLDGAPVGSFTHPPDSSSTFEYSVPVLSLENLVNEPHTLVAEPDGTSLFLFDFAIYT
ncbi:hypothetical protein GGX14DRAFT_368389 [Mycena pura]|uniref:Uncharacterized protein n=1 Tax=Mycena pura TaxID=153505 RepID=A0AAD6Y6V1_9AGAR|nr:hypothetical protein GGX14DRAFT_368389 [Mycena pura]